MGDKVQKIAVFGLGYIGLPTAAIIASRGLDVVGIDVNQKTVDIINSGQVHIEEPDLDIIVRSVVTTGNLKATTKAEAADVFIIAVPTPFTTGFKPDLSYIKSAAQAIGPVLEAGNLVVLESTVPIGTTEKLSGWLAEIRQDLVFPHTGEGNALVNVAHCPERVLPGYVLQELVNNDRVIGGVSPSCSAKASEFYSGFVKGDCVVTDSRTAEFSKLTENAYRDVNIAFANELSVISDSLDVNVWELIKLSNRHPRVDILQPGPGVGGHCIAVDPWFIVDSAPEIAKLIRTAREVNDSKPDFVVEKIIAKAEKFKRPVVACFGLSFKANIDDFRESPAVEIIEKLAAREIGDLLVVEPFVSVLPDSIKQYKNVELVNKEVALSDADIVVGLVNHNDFLKITPDKLSDKIVIDTRGMWS